MRLPACGKQAGIADCGMRIAERGLRIADCGSGFRIDGRVDGCRAARSLGRNKHLQPEGLTEVSPGQRPGNRITREVEALKGRQKAENMKGVP